PEATAEPLHEGDRRPDGTGAALSGTRRRRTGTDDRLVVVGGGDGLDDLPLAEVLRARDRRYEADQDPVAHDLRLEPGGAVVVPDRLAPVGQHDADAVLRDAGVWQFHMGEDVARGQRGDDPTSPFFF